MNIYDKVLLLYDGRQIFFGEPNAAKAFFEEMGFVCHARQTVAEFLVAVTDPTARRVRDTFEEQVPRSAQEFEDRWRASSNYAELKVAIEEHTTALEDQHAT